ncbi:hypothetical protein ASG43_20810 [Aureimonas sp. Leaf454]|nr:hypothetical protein ASG43_20810 [Aureimonas sp. Leaf454]
MEINTFALIRLGDLYRDGTALAADGAKALGYYDQAGERGEAMAFLRIAEMYRDGTRVKRNTARSIENYEKAAAAGMVRARVLLGENFAYGRYGGRSNRSRGFHLVDEAAKGGETTAIPSLANLYLSGAGTKRDPARAVDLLRQAARDGNAQAATTLISYYRDGRGSAVPRSAKLARRAFSNYGHVIAPAERKRQELLLDVSTAGSTTAYAEVARGLAGIPDAQWVQTINDMRAANPNAYVYVLQTKLAEKGLYKGSANGLLGAGTSRALASLCRQTGAALRCAYGPLSSQTTKFIAPFLR